MRTILKYNKWYWDSEEAVWIKLFLTKLYRMESVKFYWFNTCINLLSSRKQQDKKWGLKTAQMKSSLKKKIWSSIKANPFLNFCKSSYLWIFNDAKIIWLQHQQVFLGHLVKCISYFSQLSRNLFGFIKSWSSIDDTLIID